jgi:hypothetical protein
MQAGGAARRVVGTLPGRGRMEVLLTMAAVLAVAAMVAVAVWVVPLATSEVGTEDAVQKAGTGSAVVHDDAGKVGSLSIPLPHGKEVSGAPSAVVHDDAGNMPTTTGAGSAVIHDDTGNLTPQ